jgi:hypothetical protein
MNFPLHKERKPKMRKTLVSLCAAAGLFLTGTAARADMIPWQYAATDTTIYNSNNAIKTSSINFTGSSGVVSSPSNASGIIIYNLTSTSSQTTTGDTFSNVPFSLSVTLTDIKGTGSKDPLAMASGTVTFSGTYSATDVTQSSLFPGAYTYDGSSKVLKLGGADTGWNDYTIQVVSFTPPGQPGGAPGSILATVTVTPDTGGGSGSPPPPPGAPEPTSLVLAGLALPALLAARRRMKKAQVA